MKKTSVISLIIISAVIVIFALINAQPTLATKLDKQSPQFVVVVFNIVGCNSANCSASYCINGGPLQTTNSCEFKLKLAPGTYSICLTCAINRICIQTFVVNDDGSVTQYVTLKTKENSGQACLCSDSKK